SGLPCLSLYRFGPGPHRRSPPFVRVGHHHYAGVVETMPDDLQPNWQTALVVARAYRGCRLLGHIEGRGEYDVIERAGRLAARCRFVDSVSSDGRGRADEEIISLNRCHCLLAHQHDLSKGTQRFDRTPALCPPAPLEYERQNLAL